MKVLLFGLLAEKAGTAVLELEVCSLADLRCALQERIPGFERLSHAVAVDRVIVHEERPLLGGEEIAVLPPFAGG